MNTQNETILVDARGLSCPQPIFLASQALKKMSSGVVKVLVDAEAQRDNVIRMAKKSGWSAKLTKNEDDSLTILLSK